MGWLDGVSVCGPAVVSSTLCEVSSNDCVPSVVHALYVCSCVSLLIPAIPPKFFLCKIRMPICSSDSAKVVSWKCC